MGVVYYNTSQQTEVTINIKAVGSLKVVLALQETYYLLSQSIRITSILYIPRHKPNEIAAEVETIDQVNVKISYNTVYKPGS